MAGRGSRFIDAGITLPKYLLEIDESIILEKVIASFDLDHFLSVTFICLKEHVSEYRLHKTINKAVGSHENINIIAIDDTTGGQAETAYVYLKDNYIENIVIFNVDTFFIEKLDLRDSFNEHCSGSLQLFETEFGEHYSFALPSPTEQGLANIIQVTEKVRISHYASTGLYLFKNSHIFNAAFEKFISDEANNSHTESYISLIYEELIRGGATIAGFLCDEKNIKVAGTPLEYENILLNKSI